uniref:Cryptochrome circadian regulator 4 n=1 Tax=Salmo trutta TaxID=8032 RepID=A0A674DP09_SALTR
LSYRYQSRKGLRLHDNMSLVAALESSARVYPVFILDMRTGAVRWRFPLQISGLDTSLLQALGSRLYVLQGPYQGTVMRLVAQWGITQLSKDTEIEPHYTQLDQQHRIMAREQGLNIHATVAHTLYDVKSPTEGKPPLTYKNTCPSPVAEEYSEGGYRVPSVEDLGIEGQSDVLWPGGESHALMRLQSTGGWWHLNWGEQPRTIPNSLLPSTTGLSPYLSLGCLSVRAFYHSSLRSMAKVLWREFFYTVVSAMAKFTEMEGNSICLQIGWYDKEEELRKWRTEQTGLTWIDAIMTQLRQEGWIHQLARHAVACFLTRGDLWISWEEGMKLGREGHLLDAVPVPYSLNAGNWMWLSASAFFHQSTRIFCPMALEEVLLQACCIINNDYPLLMVSHQEASQRNLDLMRQICNEQENTTLLTRDVADDPMEIRLKRDGVVADEERGAKSFSSDTNSPVGVAVCIPKPLHGDSVLTITELSDSPFHCQCPHTQCL